MDWVIPAPSCVLDVADEVAAGAEPPQHEHIARWLGITKQRVQQVEAKGVANLIARARLRGLPVREDIAGAREHVDDVLYRLLLRCQDGLTMVQLAESAGISVALANEAGQRLRGEGRAKVTRERPMRLVALLGANGQELQSQRFRRSRRSIAA